MYVKDSFEKNFADRSQFMSFLDEIEERADWMDRLLWEKHP